jgi:hypothetical protein
MADAGRLSSRADQRRGQLGLDFGVPQMDQVTNRAHRGFAQLLTPVACSDRDHRPGQFSA